MLQLRSYKGLGQLQPQYAATVPPYHPIDPGVYSELRIAGELLRSQGDPYAPQTVELIKRNIEAQGFPSLGPTAVAGQPGRVSDLNPILSAVATARENPYLTIAGALFIPIFAYMLGRSSRR